ncbi:hypothetical protein Cch01nite_24900 [Cellulomonas chitinilytica]|uniref:Uncharacterized protein n=2 Tax=Cellulomonas chitinilytica TaxID=398759 RepID=A0A919P523_9CELL|nr:hypothetical protein Cch01nite_24900 [Cellulomonas chitinilytica]
MGRGKPLPGVMVDLVRDGADLAGGRNAVVRALRRVMLSAHRLGWTFADFHELLTQPGSALGRQVSTGRGGRPMPRQRCSDFVLRHWNETAQVVAERGPWDRDDVLEFLDFVRKELDGATMDERRRQVLRAVVDIALERGTSRPAATCRDVGERVGISHRAANETLNRLAAEGEWLQLVRRGSYEPRRANLYAVAPRLAVTYGGAKAPYVTPPPMSHPPMSHPTDQGEARMSATTDPPRGGSLTMSLTAEESVEVAKFVAAMRAAPEPAGRPSTASEAAVVPLDARRRASGAR